MGGLTRLLQILVKSSTVTKNLKKLTCYNARLPYVFGSGSDNLADMLSGLFPKKYDSSTSQLHNFSIYKGRSKS